MIYIIVIGLIIFSIISVCVRLIVTHPVSVPIYSVVDLFLWIKHRGWNVAPTGKLDCYAAHFGGGKTLSVAHYVRKYYKRYNDKLVYDRSLKNDVVQKVHVISNVNFNSIPYEKLESLSQVVNHAEHGKEIDRYEMTRTVFLVIIDEASVQLNSRNFKSNIDPTFLNTLLTSRHYHISILYTSQKFNLTDKLMRDVTQKVIQCKKVWRLMVQYVYDADEIEYASNPSLVKPIKRTGFFIRNKDYNTYDTLAVVGNLKKSVESGDMLSEAEIIALRHPASPDDNAINNPSRKLKRRRKKAM